MDALKISARARSCFLALHSRVAQPTTAQVSSRIISNVIKVERDSVRGHIESTWTVLMHVLT